jgi:hypothetical protein
MSGATITPTDHSGSIRVILGTDKVYIFFPPSSQFNGDAMRKLFLKSLSYQHRDLEAELNEAGYRTGRFNSVSSEVCLVNILNEFPLQVFTFPGFFGRVVKFLKQYEPVTITDARDISRLVPRMDLVHGLRDYQIPVFNQFITQLRNGTIVLPTRWGNAWARMTG